MHDGWAARNDCQGETLTYFQKNYVACNVNVSYLFLQKANEFMGKGPQDVPSGFVTDVSLW